MGYVFRKVQVRTQKTGRKVRRKSVNFYGRYRRGKKWVPVPLHVADEDAARDLLADIERREAKVTRGTLDRFELAAQEPIETHLDDWCESMAGRGVTAKEVRQKVARVRRVAAFGDWKSIADVDSATVERFIAMAKRDGLEHAGRRRKGDEVPKFQIKRQTGNHYKGACKSFAKWLHESRRLRDNPLIGVKGETVTDAAERGILTVVQLEALYRSVELSTAKRLNMAGGHRRLLYQLALETGFRLNELLTLRWGDVDLGRRESWIRVVGRYAKNKREHEQPIRAALATLLRKHHAASGKPGPDSRVFPSCDRSRVARALRKDLADAGFNTIDADGHRIDFHGLRHSFGFIMRDLAEPDELQRVMRHSRYELTQRYIRHRVRAGLAQTMGKLDGALKQAAVHSRRAKVCASPKAAAS